jgi:hypothetical protein
LSAWGNGKDAIDPDDSHGVENAPKMIRKDAIDPDFSQVSEVYEAIMQTKRMRLTM